MPAHKGSANHNARLTEAQALAILQRRQRGESGSLLAREYGVSRQLICDIAHGRRWSHLQQA